MESLPRQEVMQFLERTNLDACVGYLEHVVKALYEESAEFHDKLAELYLAGARSPAKHVGTGPCKILT